MAETHHIVLYNLHNFGEVPYAEALSLQHDLRSQTLDGKMLGALILCVHKPCITFGAGGDFANLLCSQNELEKMGIEFVKTDRGGDVTYHGPGQLVGYPILQLKYFGKDLHKYLRDLEETIILTLKEYGIKGYRDAEAGVWVGGLKICSIGIAVRKWVAYHGFALNVNPNMDHFKLINPCGLKSDKMTSLANVLGYSPEMSDIINKYIAAFKIVFGVELNQME